MFYYYFFNNPNEKPEETFFSDSFIWYLTPIYIMFSFYISGLLIYGLFLINWIDTIARPIIVAESKYS
jgi:hypothetical protein